MSCHSINLRRFWNKRTCAVQGHFGNALEEYLIAYSLAPDSVLVLLCLGINYLNQCMSRKIPNRDHTILAAFTFLQVSSFTFVL